MVSSPTEYIPRNTTIPKALIDEIQIAPLRKVITNATPSKLSDNPMVMVKNPPKRIMSQGARLRSGWVAGHPEGRCMIREGWGRGCWWVVGCGTDSGPPAPNARWVFSPSVILVRSGINPRIAPDANMLSIQPLRRST